MCECMCVSVCINVLVSVFLFFAKDSDFLFCAEPQGVVVGGGGTQVSITLPSLHFQVSTSPLCLIFTYTVT